jgi:DNA-directed RNA polymerase specialized sigma24 family protein
LVTKKFDPVVGAGAAPVEPKSSVHSDLQYVSIQVDGSTYGGWYRLLPDGQMELLALANMHCERRSENTPVEQARGMLTDFIRGVRRKANAGAAPTSTLGALLYADATKARVPEPEWVGLLQAVAAGDASALHGLYERAYPAVYTLLVRLTHSLSVAEDLTVDVFHEIWSRASKYDAAEGSALGWMMNHARAKAIDYWGLDWGKRAIARDREAQSHWPADVLRPSQSLWPRLAERLSLPGTFAVTAAPWIEPEWEDAAPGISVKVLATDVEKDRVSMLVRLAPGTDYPPHTHAGVEELHLLQGELLIDARKLSPGDYNRAEPGSSDKRVWSDTGCMCVLMTSTRDALGG